MCLKTTTRYLCSHRITEIEPCERITPESEPFCDDDNIKRKSIENQESLCLECHRWVRDVGGEEILEGLYEDFRKLASKPMGPIGEFYGKAIARKTEVNRFWEDFQTALAKLDEKEDFSNRMRGVVRGQEPVLDELAFGLRKVNLAASSGGRMPKKEERGSRIRSL